MLASADAKSTGKKQALTAWPRVERGNVKVEFISASRAPGYPRKKRMRYRRV